MHAFDYHRPKTMKEAVALLRKVENAKPLAGGQSLIAALKLRLASPRRSSISARSTSCAASSWTAGRSPSAR